MLLPLAVGRLSVLRDQNRQMAKLLCRLEREAPLVGRIESFTVVPRLRRLLKPCKLPGLRALAMAAPGCCAEVAAPPLDTAAFQPPVTPMDGVPMEVGAWV